LSFALVIFKQDILNRILKSEILQSLDDSKKLTEKKREELFDLIYSLADYVGHQFISNKFIDKYGMSYSIFTAIRKLVLKAKSRDLFLLIDGNYDFKAHQENSNFFFKYKSIVKGDSKVASIAAASIIAKVKRDRFMNAIDKKYPMYEFSKHKGYGTKLHVSKIKMFGFSPIHRLSFKLKDLENGN
jgi:ribonuclease HII